VEKRFLAAGLKIQVFRNVTHFNEKRNHSFPTEYPVTILSKFNFFMIFYYTIFNLYLFYRHPWNNTLCYDETPFWWLKGRSLLGPHKFFFSRCFCNYPTDQSGAPGAKNCRLRVFGIISSL